MLFMLSVRRWTIVGTGAGMVTAQARPKGSPEYKIRWTARRQPVSTWNGSQADIGWPPKRGSAAAGFVTTDSSRSLGEPKPADGGIRSEKAIETLRRGRQLSSTASGPYATTSNCPASSRAMVSTGSQGVFLLRSSNSAACLVRPQSDGPVGAGPP